MTQTARPPVDLSAVPVLTEVLDMPDLGETAAEACLVRLPQTTGLPNEEPLATGAAPATLAPSAAMDERLWERLSEHMSEELMRRLQPLVHEAVRAAVAEARLVAPRVQAAEAAGNDLGEDRTAGGPGQG